MNTLSELKELIHTTFDIDPATLDPNKPLADYGLDSLSLAELLFVVEEKFHIDFVEPPKGIATLTDLSQHIDRKRLQQLA